MTPSITVVMPNFNDARYLPRSLGSVFAQEDAPDEIVVVDDRSTDESVSVIRSLIEGRVHARLVENPVNLGVYGAINEGLRHARSDYVLFLASNDFVLPGIFARARSAFARHPQAGLWSAMGWLVDAHDNPLRPLRTPLASLRDAYLTPERCRRLAWRYGNWFTGTTVIFRSDVLKKFGGFDPAYKGLSDLVMALTVAARQGALYSPAPMAVVRVHEGSHSGGTVGRPEAIETILERLSWNGPALAPELFSRAFLERTALRWRYAVVRASDANITPVAGRLERCRGRALLWMAGWIPASMRRARWALAYLILRPFDLLPGLWMRIVGALFVAMSPAWSRTAVTSARRRSSA